MLPRSRTGLPSQSSSNTRAAAIWKFANGEGVSVVEAEPADVKSYGNATTIAFDVTDEATAGMVLMSLAEKFPHLP